MLQGLLLLPALLAALWLGWLLQQRLGWLQHGLWLQGEVVDLHRSTRVGPTGSSRSAVRLEVEVDVVDPRREDRPARVSLLAPTLYPLLQPGDRLTLLHDPLTQPANAAFVPAHPLSLGLAPALGLLVVGVLWAFPYTGLLKRHPQPGPERRRAARRLQALLVVAAALPVVAGQALALRDRAARQADLSLEARWPSWPELDAAAPRPWWWARLPWRGLDPLQAGSEAQLAWLRAGGLGEDDRAQRRYKLVRAQMLGLRERPAELAALLSAGHDPQFIPLYRFYLQHYLHAEWREPGCSRCNDASLVTEMAGDLMTMLIHDGRLDEAGHWAPLIAARKLSGADARARLSFLSAYRGWLEASQGAEAARAQLQPLVDNAIVAARDDGETWALARWEAFWRSHVPRPPGH